MSDEIDRTLSNGVLRERRNAQHGEKQDEVRVEESSQPKVEGCEKTVGKTPDGSSELSKSPWSRANGHPATNSLLAPSANAYSCANRHT